MLFERLNHKATSLQIKSHSLKKRTAFGGDAGSSVSTDAHQPLLSQGQKQFLIVSCKDIIRLSDIIVKSWL